MPYHACDASAGVIRKVLPRAESGRAGWHDDTIAKENGDGRKRQPWRT